MSGASPPGRDPGPPGQDPLPPGRDPLQPGQDPLQPGQDPLPPGQDPGPPTGKPATAATPGWDQRVDGELLPALVDAHVHSQLADVGALRSGGIAAVWDLGGELSAVRGVGAPVVRYAGPFLIAPGGYPSDRAWAPAGSCRPIHSPADAAEAVSWLAEAGATLIKATAHTGGPMLPPATLAALVAAAHALSLPVVVHAEGPGTVAAACDAGADLLAHTPWTERLADGVLRACAERMTWISTLAIHPDPDVGTPLDNLRRFLSAGGRVRYGTDLGNGPQPAGVNPRELRALQAAGLSPADVLAAMTDPDHPAATWVPGGLDRDPARFADSLATARVADTRDP